jgi:hypothetical protein
MENAFRGVVPTQKKTGRWPAFLMLLLVLTFEPVAADNQLRSHRSHVDLAFCDRCQLRIGRFFFLQCLLENLCCI